MNPLVLRYGEPLPEGFAENVNERERPVVWLDVNGSLREMVSHAWLTKYNVYYYQRLLPSQKQMDMATLTERQSTVVDKQKLCTMYDRMEVQLQQMHASDSNIDAVWDRFVREKAALLEP